MPTFDDFRNCHQEESTELYVRFVSDLVLSVRGKMKNHSCFLSVMKSFESVDLTVDTEAFTLFVIADKEEVWQAMLESPEEPKPSPKFTLSKQFKKKGIPLSTEGHLLYDTLISEVQQYRLKDEQEDNSRLLNAVKAYQLEKVDSRKRKRYELSEEATKMNKKNAELIGGRELKLSAEPSPTFSAEIEDFFKDIDFSTMTSWQV